MSFFTKEVRIALAAIVSIVLLFFGMNFLKGKSLFSNDNVYFAKFDNISGLTASNPIFVNGYQVGTVKTIDFDYAHGGSVIVGFGADRQLVIPAGTTAEIESDMMGNLKVNLLLGHDATATVHPGDTITGRVNGGLMDTVAELAPTIGQMLPKLDSIMARLNTLLADPAVANSLHNVEGITANLNTSTRELNTLLGTLNRNVPGMMANANGVLDNTERLTGNLAAVDVAGTMAKVDQTVANMEQFTAKLNSNEGTLGLLLNDRQLYLNLNKTLVSADTLLNNLREHPKRYVHFSLFGKKDK